MALSASNRFVALSDFSLVLTVVLLSRPVGSYAQEEQAENTIETVVNPLRDFLTSPIHDFGQAQLTISGLLITVLIVTLGLWGAIRISAFVGKWIISWKELSVSALTFFRLAIFVPLALLVLATAFYAAGIPLSAVGAILNFPIVTVDRVPLTPKKVVFAIFVLALGIHAAQRLSQMLCEDVFARVGLNVAFVETIRTGFYYVFIFLVILIVLSLLNIPLTAFAVFGGALAIGIGFGSQNIVNNFISGLILLVERPVRIGDTVELDGLFGVVRRVGARCTNVRTFSNVDIMVPNSFFLENRVVNWTLKDQTIRKEMIVGVAYGSPTRVVEQLLLDATAEHQEILEDPAPDVLFMDFGDSALVFELRFWVDLSISSSVQVASDIRFRIDELFRENNIAIPFPQRDVHFDALDPIRVELTRKRNDDETMAKHT